MKTCPECDGHGVIERGTDEEQQCPTCGGSGFVADDEDDNRNEEVIRTGGEGQPAPENNCKVSRRAFGTP